MAQENVTQPVAGPGASRLQRLMGTSWPASYPLVQFPNPPLIAAILADGVGRATEGGPHRLALAVYYLGLGVWAYEEIVRGENLFRRLFGAGGGAYIALSLQQALSH